jgi:hypothetical protein
MNNRTMEVVMLDMARQASVRDERGRFVPGMSGNPAGKLPGTRNRATVLRAALDSAEGPAMARIVIVRRRGDGEVLRCAADAAAAQPGDRDRSALWGAGARPSGGVRRDGAGDGGGGDHAGRGGAGEPRSRRQAQGDRGGVAGGRTNRAVLRSKALS